MPALFARTLERELAEKELALAALQVELGSARLVARSYYDALGKESAKLTAAKQDSERLEWLLAKLTRESRDGVWDRKYVDSQMR